MGDCHCWAFYKDILVYEGTKWQDFGHTIVWPCLIQQTASSLLCSFCFFLDSWSRIDKSEAQYKQQMGQSLVFVFMPPIAIEGEETKQEPQTHLPFYPWSVIQRSREPRAAAVLKNPHLGIGTLSEIHSHTDLESNSTLTTAPQASWGRRGESNKF